jgi:hypothetical protein
MMSSPIRPTPGFDKTETPISSTIATPEGDNEFPPDVPLTPLPAAALETPRGSAPDLYRQPD